MVHMAAGNIAMLILLNLISHIVMTTKQLTAHILYIYLLFRMQSHACSHEITRHLTSVFPSTSVSVSYTSMQFYPPAHELRAIAKIVFRHTICARSHTHTHHVRNLYRDLVWVCVCLFV